MNATAPAPTETNQDVYDIALITEGEPTMPPPVAAPATDVVHGRVTGTGPAATGRPQFRGNQGGGRPFQHGHQGGYQPAGDAPAITELQAKRMIVDGLTTTLRHLSSLGEAERVDGLKTLVRGTSPTGFVQTMRGVKVDSIEGLRSLSLALHRLTTVKTFANGSKLLFFFAVPRGWVAYAGEVKVDPLVRYYLGKDRKAAAVFAAWEKRKLEAETSGQPFTEVMPPTVPPLVKDPHTGTEWGGWVQALRKGTKVDFVKMPVMGPSGVKEEFKAILVNDLVPLHRARTLTFVVDKASGRLEAWQSGRFIAGMTPSQRMDRVLLTSGEITDEPI